MPHTAILDPQLLAGAPDKVLAYCAIDAFTHLFEAHLSKTAGAMTRDMSLSGIRHFLAARPALNRATRRAKRLCKLRTLGADAERRRGWVIHGIAGEIRRAARLPRAVCGRLLPFLPCWKAANSRSNAR